VQSESGEWTLARLSLHDVEAEEKNFRQRWRSGFPTLRFSPSATRESRTAFLANTAASMEAGFDGQRSRWIFAARSVKLGSMKRTIISALAALSLLISGQQAFAAETNSASAELKDLVARINAKLKQDQKLEADLAGELKEFDALVAKHKGEDPEELSQIMAMKAGLYLQVLDQPDKAADVFKQIKRDFPQTKTGQRTDEILAMLAQQQEVKKIQDSLVVGAKFPDFNEKDLAGKPLSIANDKGKVVLLDFWATWCGPCVMELPNVIETYKKHHAGGFEIIGISLDENQGRLQSFIKDKQMTWPQFFDGKKWQNKLAVKYGVNSIPATYLLDREGKIIGKDLRGEELEKAVVAALAKK
jgi:thiol-disulfide isomerase/thioredoxin